MLQNLVQFMNLIGQNPQAWLPYINQDALLRRMLEAFRPHIHDIEDIIADPAIVEAKKAEMQQNELGSDMLRMIPQLLQMKQDQTSGGQDATLELQRQQHEREMQKGEMQIQQSQQAAEQQSQQQAMAQSQLEHQQTMQQLAAKPPQGQKQ